MEEKVGKLCLDRSGAIAVGNFGTTFKGTFEGTIDVAVKRFEKEEFEVDLKAICRVNNHQNILRFYCSEENFDFVYIALDRTVGTLKDLAHGKYAVHAVGDWQKVLHQITSGLDHLHRKQVIHGHLKPKNILVSYPDGGVPPMIKLANFGIAHRIISGDGNPVTLWKLGGSKGWLPAEAYVKTNFTTEMDVYALGLVFFYSLSKGCHPFGKDKEERDIRMKRSEHKVFTADQLKNVTNPEKVVQLINWMLSSDPSARPTTTQLFMDAFFSSTTAARDVASSELEIPRTPKNIKKEVTDDDEIAIVAEYFPQSKRAKRNESPVLVEEPITDSSQHHSLSSKNSSGCKPTAFVGLIETLPGPSHRNPDAPPYASDDEASLISQPSQPEEHIDRKCFTYDDGTSTDNDDEYKSRSKFFNAVAYSRYVRKRIVKGMRVRCCASVESIDLFLGQTGIVVAINREMEINIKVKWDGVQKPNWVKYKQVEILEDAATEMSDSESLGAEDLQSDESTDEYSHTENFIGIQSDECSRSANNSIMRSLLCSTADEPSENEDFNENEEDQETQDADNSTDDHKLEKELIQLCKKSRYWKKRSFDRFRHLVLDGAVNVNYTDDEGLTALLLLCWKPKNAILLNCIEILLQRPDIDLSVCDDGEWNALPIVCRWYRGPKLPNIVQLFLDRGIDLNTFDRNRDNALIVACANVKHENLFEVVQLLIQHEIEINATNSKNWNALHALFFNYQEQNVMGIAQLLLDAGIAVEVKTQDGWNSLLALTQNHHGHPDYVSMMAKLLERGADVHASDRHGWNILHSLCSYYKGNNIVQIIHLLVRFGLDINAKDLDNWNALIFTSRSPKQGGRFIEIARVMIELGIDLNTQEEDGFTVLHFLCQEVTKRNNLHNVRFLVEETNINVNLRDKRGRKPLDLLRKISKTKRISIGLQRFQNVIQLIEERM